MLITNLLVAGSVAYAGVKTATVPTQRQPNSISSTELSQATNSEPVVTTTDPTNLPTLAQRRQRALAATSMWLSVGGVFIPSLTLVSIPLTVYSAVPILEAGCRSLFREGRLKPSVINSILIGSTLLGDHYFTAAAFAWLHHAFQQVGQQIQSKGQQVSNEINGEVGELLRQAMGGPPRTVWLVQEGIEVKVPFEQIKVGDVVVISRGEFIPVDGAVISGTATVNLLLITRSPNPETVQIGDKVYTNTFVTEGRINIRVDEIRTRTGA